MSKPNQKGVLVLAAVIGLALGVVATMVFFGGKAAANENVTSAGAPPLFTHKDFTEETCASCHAPGVSKGESKIPVTPHPERASCRQCHVHLDTGIPLFVENSYGK